MFVFDLVTAFRIVGCGLVCLTVGFGFGCGLGFDCSCFGSHYVV